MKIYSRENTMRCKRAKKEKERERTRQNTNEKEKIEKNAK